MAIRSVRVPWDLNTENYEERELLKQLLELQAMFVVLFGQEFSQLIENQLGDKYPDLSRTLYNLADLFAQKQTSLKQFVDASIVSVFFAETVETDEGKQRSSW